MADLIDTTEMYLKTILELEEDGVTPLRARIVDRLGHSGPTVSQTVARMERDGLLHVMGDRRLELCGAHLGGAAAEASVSGEEGLGDVGESHHGNSLVFSGRVFPSRSLIELS